MLTIEFTSKMKRDVKRSKKRGKDMNKLDSVLRVLASQESIPTKYNDHQLVGELYGYRECHIEPDWLLIYQVCEEELILSAIGTGSHSDLFES